MSLTAQNENAKALAKTLGLEDEEAVELLSMPVLVRAASHATARAIEKDVSDLLARTVARVVREAVDAPKVEVAIGRFRAASAWPVVRVGVTSSEIIVSSEAIPEHDDTAESPPIVLLIAACYAAAMAVRLGLGRGFPLPFAETIRVPTVGLTRGADLTRPTDLGKVYLAGAGAIGNGVLQALARVHACGELHIVDPKLVSAGNLSRCLWFAREDIGSSKAECLVARAQSSVPSLRLVPRVGRLQDLHERSSGAWLERLVVAVDSRRARRGLQEELPRAVLDASTTGIEEVVLHFNRAGGTGACLSCIYVEDVTEAAHEKHVASMLGVSITDVKQHYISPDAARRITARHPQLDPGHLAGTAYDTLFKTLCATGELGVDEGRTILAPFSFVSVLAGAYLALELVLRASVDDVSGPFNYWRASPWTSPVLELQASRPRREKCETCGNPMIRSTMKQLWG